MTETLVEVEGVEDATRMLDDSTRSIAGRGMLKGLQAGAAVFVAELEITTPIQTEAGQDREPGTLRAALMTDIELDARQRGGQVDVGYGKQGHVANWVEYGHEQVTHGGQRKGFTPAHPFLRPAFDAGAPRAIEAFRGALLAALAEDDKVNTEEVA